MLLAPSNVCRFEFTGRFDVELTDDCGNDYVEFQVWNVTSNTWSGVSDRKCGRVKPETVISPAGRTQVLFRSNRNVNGDGFRLNWFLDCGGVFESSSGSFTSPGTINIFECQL